MTIEEIVARDYRAAEAEATAYERRAARAEFWFDVARGIGLAVVLAAFFGAVAWLSIAARERREAERGAAEAEAVRVMVGGERIAAADRQESAARGFFWRFQGGSAMRNAIAPAFGCRQTLPFDAIGAAAARPASADAPRFRFFPALKV